MSYTKHHLKTLFGAKKVLLITVIEDFAIDKDTKDMTSAPPYSQSYVYDLQEDCFLGRLEKGKLPNQYEPN